MPPASRSSRAKRQPLQQNQPISSSGSPQPANSQSRIAVSSAPIEHVIAGAEIAVAQHRRQRLRNMRFEPAYRPFEHRPRVGMPVEIGAEPGDVPGRIDMGQKREVGARRPDRLYPRQFRAEPRRRGGQMRLQRRVCRDLPSLRGAGDPPHDEKRPADHLGVGAGPERLRHRDPGREGRPLHREFLDPAEARRDAGRRVGAQHQGMLSGKGAAGKFGLEAPILLDRAARAAVPARLPGHRSRRSPGPENAARRSRIKSRQRRGRHPPRSPRR